MPIAGFSGCGLILEKKHAVSVDVSEIEKTAETNYYSRLSEAIRFKGALITW